MDNRDLLSVSGLGISLVDRRNSVNIVKGISFTLARGMALGLVGESGSGKTVTALSIAGLLPQSMRIVSGSIVFDGEELINAVPKRRRELLGDSMAMVFQEPMTSLNPLITVGRQIYEPVAIHRGLSEKAAYGQVIDAMKLADIPDPERLYGYYPHQLSGGLRQRVMIAMALINSPKLLIADEPTTALDAHIQAQILNQLIRACKELDTAILLISHDLSMVGRICSHVAVMSSGRIVEYGESADVLGNPRHQYTKALLASIPSIDKRGGRLSGPKGAAPGLGHELQGCDYSDRCENAGEECRRKKPSLTVFSGTHTVACHSAFREGGNGTEQ